MSSGTAGLRCDICRFRDGHQQLTLIQCTDCQVAVHKECYGMDTYLKKTFLCWACQAKGKSFQVDKIKPNGVRQTITQTERPSECVLCSVSTGVHAMHPIYDSGGTKGRQICIWDPVPKLAWVHSLCAFYLATQGFLYVCARDGSYDGDDEDEDDSSGDDDDRSVNPELQTNPVEELSNYRKGTMPVHHFVYYVPTEGAKFTSYVRAVQKQKKNLKCILCGSDDSSDSVYRIPIQCCAGNENEHGEFKKTHYSLGEGEVCTLAVHVGCANWSPNTTRARRVYYFPGNSVMDTVNAVYCNLHAEEVGGSFKKHVTPMQERVAPPRKKALPPTDMSVLPSLAKKSPAKKTKRPSATLSTAKSTKATTTTTIEPTHIHPKKLRHAVLDKNEAISVGALERPTLSKNRKALANKKSLVDKILKDLSEQILGKGYDREARAAVMTQRRKYWKKQLADSKADEFKKLWHTAKELLFPAVWKEQNPDEQASPNSKTAPARAAPTTINLAGDDDDDDDDDDDREDNGVSAMDYSTRTEGDDEILEGGEKPNPETNMPHTSEGKKPNAESNDVNDTATASLNSEPSSPSTKKRRLSQSSLPAPGPLAQEKNSNTGNTTKQKVGLSVSRSPFSRGKELLSDSDTETEDEGDDDNEKEFAHLFLGLRFKNVRHEYFKCDYMTSV